MHPIITDTFEKDMLKAERDIMNHLKLLEHKSPLHKIMVNALINLQEAEGEQFFELIDEELEKMEENF
jgi:hypothetical protein